MKSGRIILADDHEIMREGLKSLIGKNPALTVVGEAGNGKELLALLETVPCDLIVADIAMPVMDGLTALKAIKETHPDLKVLMLSMFNDYQHFERAKAFGAAGFLAKDDASEELVRAIEKILQGKSYVSPAFASVLAKRQLHIMEEGKSPSLELLTKRERQVLSLLAKGATNKKMAAALMISIHTVENHRAHLSEKLGIKNTASLVRYAIEKGLI